MFRMRSTVITLLAIAIGLFVYNPVAFANHGGSTAAPWHSDVMTINQTGSLGTNGTKFIPAWVKTDCDTVPVNGIARSTDDPSAAGCHSFAEEVTNAWLEGGYWDPRGGTEFIPPSGDHHRAGWRTMMQAHFSAGAWLAGFAPIATSFPFYPQVGVAGPGETPVGTYELCMDADGAGPGGQNQFTNTFSAGIDTDSAPIDGPTTTSAVDAELTSASITHTPGDVADIVACRQAARAAGALLLEFVDHHGEPMTPGRFPRYIPHERQAWVATVVTKYTASPLNNIDTDGDQISDQTGARISQVFRSQHNFVTDRAVTWFSMSDESAAPCNGTGWCQWLWDPATGTLLKLDNANPGDPSQLGGGTPDVATMVADGATTVDSVTVIDDYNDVLTNKPLNDIEKAPSEIYQTIGQWVELGGFTGASNGSPAEDTQAFWQEFWGLSGPNFQSEEGANPYSWMLCGNPADSPANSPCATSSGAAKDAPLRTGSALEGSGTLGVMAITRFGLDLINRYGEDLRPDNSTDQGCVQGDAGDGVCNDTACAATGTDCDKGLNTAVVICQSGGDEDFDPRTSDCLSSEGGTPAYGNDAAEVIYYREAVENQQRGFIRENRAFAFSFINGVGLNNGFPGSGLSTALRQAVAQNVDENGFLMSCMNCEEITAHRVATHPLPNYNFTWTVTGGVTFVEHSDIVAGDHTGSIP
jgi:hypothetical protein